MRIDIRDKRLRGGRATLDAKTERRVEQKRRETMIRTLLDQGEVDIIEGIRTRKLDITEVQKAHETKGKQRDEELSLLRARVYGVDINGPYLGEFVDRVLEEAKGSLSAGTLKNNQQHADRLLDRFGRDRSMASVLTAEASSYLTEGKATLDGKPWSAGSQHGARMFAHKVWKLAIETEEEWAEQSKLPPRITRNPWKKAKHAKDRSARVEFLRPAEWIAVRDGSLGLPRAALLALGCLAGLRAAEAAYLRTGIDIDMERRLVLIRKRTGAFPWKPKNKRGVRDVPMADELHEILAQHIESGYAGRTFFLSAPGSNRPLSHSNIIKQTHAGFTVAGVDYGRKKDALTFHSLRHTFASWLTQKGMHPKKVARLMGDTPEMILKVYGHLAEDDHNEAVELLNTVVKA